MNPDVLNMQIRKYLKQVGVTSQREIEGAIREALDNGQLQGDERLQVRMTLTVDQLELTHIVEDIIALE